MGGGAYPEIRSGSVNLRPIARGGRCTEQAGIDGVSEPRLRAHVWSAPTFSGGPATVTYVFGFTVPERATVSAGRWIARRRVVTVLDASELLCVADLADPLRVPTVDYREHL